MLLSFAGSKKLWNKSADEMEAIIKAIIWGIHDVLPNNIVFEMEWRNMPANAEMPPYSRKRK